jgi:rhodanese-related sulfurtransferase
VAKPRPKLPPDDENVVLINVLSEEEFEEAHIPRSINVPLGRDDFVDRVVEIAGDKNRPIVVHGATFKCPASTAAAQRLEDGGLTDVYDLEGRPGSLVGRQAVCRTRGQDSLMEYCCSGVTVKRAGEGMYI